MTKTIFLRIFVIFLTLTVYVFAQDQAIDTKEQPKTLFKKSSTLQDISSDPYSLDLIKELISQKAHEDDIDIIIQQEKKEIEKIIKNINDEQPAVFDIEKFDKQIEYLSNKININSRYGNTLAIQRDSVKISILENKLHYFKTINNIIRGKNSFKDKRYFESLLGGQIKRLKDYDLKEYKGAYDLAKNEKDKVSLEFAKQYANLDIQIKAQQFVLGSLRKNIDLYRKSYLLFDELSLGYVIGKIDSLPIVSNVSEFMNYYLFITLGEISTVVFIMALFVLFKTKVLSILISFARSFLIKKSGQDWNIFNNYVRKSMETPFFYMLYLLAAEISLYILVKNNNILNIIDPWINTAYMALFIWMLYMLLSNWIDFFADDLFEKYPNVRKEMVDFVLRISKIIFFFFVLLFLLIELGFDVKAILASLGIGGIAIALAAKDTLSNFFGSINIIADNAFSQGDWIQAGDIEGTVVDIRMRTTRIRTFSNALITVPNAELANMSIMNWSKRRLGRRIKMHLGITYDSGMENIKNLVEDLRQMLSEYHGIASDKTQVEDKLKSPKLLIKEDLLGVKRKLMVYIDRYSDSSVDILIYCFSRSPKWEDWLQIKEDIIIKIDELVHENGCEFAFPTQTVHLAK